MCMALAGTTCKANIMQGLAATLHIGYSSDGASDCTLYEQICICHRLSNYLDESIICKYSVPCDGNYCSLYGVLHTWNSNLRNKRFRRTRDIRAILWATHLACASMAAQAALIGALATLWRVRRSFVCVTAPTDGRTESPTSLRKSRP